MTEPTEPTENPEDTEPTENTGPADPIAARMEILRAVSGRPVRPGSAYRSGGARRRRPRPKTTKTRYDGRADRSYRDPGTFGDLVKREIKRNGWGRNFAVGQLRSAWPEIVGENIGRHTHVVMYNEKKRQLHVESDSTAWATNLRLMQTTILQTIAHRVGPDVVAELKIYGPKAPSWRHGPLHVSGRGPRDTYG